MNPWILIKNSEDKLFRIKFPFLSSSFLSAFLRLGYFFFFQNLQLFDIYRQLVVKFWLLHMRNSTINNSITPVLIWFPTDSHHIFFPNFGYWPNMGSRPLGRNVPTHFFWTILRVLKFLFFYFLHKILTFSNKNRKFWHTFDKNYIIDQNK